MLFIPLLKADAISRRVYARLDETVDRTNEAMDYAASASVFKAWSAGQAAVTDGKSQGNVRGQHGKVAAGVVSDIVFDDAACSIEFAIDVVDDGEWEKVIKGVYTGISPGGRAKRTKGPDGVTRYAMLSLNEISLVDVPCNPDATFTLLKADGMEEQVAFHPAAPAETSTELLKALSDAPTLRAFGAVVAPLSADALEKSLAVGGSFGPGVKASLFSADIRRALAASGEAMPDGSFPLTDQIDLEASLAAIEKAADAMGARAHLVSRAVALDLADVLPAEMLPAIAIALGTKVEKGLGDVSRLAGLLDSLTWLSTDVIYEAGAEMDGSPLPGRLAVWIGEGASILMAMAGEEASEAAARLQAAVALLPMPINTIQKSAGLHGDQMSVVLKMAGDLADTRDALTKAHGASSTLRAELDTLRARPAPGGIRLHAIGRSDDVGPTDSGSADPMSVINAMPDGMAKARAMTRFEMTGCAPAART